MASHNPAVKILETVRVSPFTNSPTHFSLTLTSLDAMVLKFPPVETLLFYQLTASTLLRFNSEILPKLIHSLSLTLQHYLPLAGKLTWPPHAHLPIISYAPHDAVSFLVAEANLDFNRLSADDIRESPESRCLVPELLSSDEVASIMALQITLFPNQGFCIGITTHHAVVDGSTAIAFMKSWAYLCTQLVVGKQHPSLLPELIPFFDRRVLEDLTGFKASNIFEFKQRSLKLKDDLGVKNNSVRATLKLSHEDIKNLKEKILSKLQEKIPTKQLNLSTFVVTYAYVLVCLVKARQMEDNKNVNFLFQVDCRSRLDPLLLANYFGNCILARDASVKASVFKEENGVTNIAEKINDMVRDISEKGPLDGVVDRCKRIQNIVEAGEEFIRIGGSTRFKFYGVDYGWGKPKKVEIISIDKTGAFTMLETGDGNGVEIGKVLSRHEMETFKSLLVSGLQDP
ncbi:phenolic glucoside malonyltransferase 1-like [Mangifera indica]|uniref:phenolic glucoside malonyltransferase 1-like n=1 Tax=Mangifera indica TaxID=29780 RepID=UPI001CFA5B88|nr:phenolic glucoside malonyltransferase 1-like [Mangifera indica]